MTLLLLQSKNTIEMDRKNLENSQIAAYEMLFKKDQTKLPAVFC